MTGYMNEIRIILIIHFPILITISNSGSAAEFEKFGVRSEMLFQHVTEKKRHWYSGNLNVQISIFKSTFSRVFNIGFWHAH